MNLQCSSNSIGVGTFLLACVLGSSGHKKNGCARRRHARGEGASLTPRVSPSRAPFFSFAHYFQAPATQATFLFETSTPVGLLTVNKNKDAWCKSKTNSVICDRMRKTSWKLMMNAHHMNQSRITRRWVM